MRLDVALFGLRLYKSRSQATDAIQAGHVHVNGAPAKPSREVHPGDRVTLTTHAGTRTLEIVDLPRGSLSKERAQALLRPISQR